MSGISIAVIDDGVSNKKINDLAFDLIVDASLSVKCRRANRSGDDSHGTVCAQIIRKYAPDSIIGSIKILNSKTKAGYVERLEAALLWCAKNNVSIVNLSLGSTQSQDYKPLKSIIDFVYSKRVIVVAAINNQNTVSYPASFPNVIGVCADFAIGEGMHYVVAPDVRGINVYASSFHGNQFISIQGNSFAVPLVTAKIYDILKKAKTPCINSILAALSKNASIDVVPSKSGGRDDIGQLEIPSIVICLAREGNFRVACDVNEQFIADGYNTLFISTTRFGAYDNAYHIVQKQLDDKYILSESCKFETDIILIVIAENHLNTGVKLNCDILFSELRCGFADRLFFEKLYYFDSNEEGVADIIYNLSTMTLE
ncbi:MAG: S8 family serine peptidase [Clostridiales bacterium]|nr:S8 family serine peptidase [Clostridiales bacterium]